MGDVAGFKAYEISTVVTPMPSSAWPRPADHRVLIVSDVGLCREESSSIAAMSLNSPLGEDQKPCPRN